MLDQNPLNYLVFRNDDIAVFHCFDKETESKIIFSATDSRWEHHRTLANGSNYYVIFRTKETYPTITNKGLLS
jgi:hypothetical protein